MLTDLYFADEAEVMSLAARVRSAQHERCQEHPGHIAVTEVHRDAKFRPEAEKPDDAGDPWQPDREQRSDGVHQRRL